MSDTDRDVGQSDDEAHNLDTEFLDDTSDAHATLFGFWKGIRKMKPRPEYEESKKEPHYFKFGYILGTLTQVVLTLLGVYGIATF